MPGRAVVSRIKKGLFASKKIKTPSAPPASSWHPRLREKSALHQRGSQVSETEDQLKQRCPTGHICVVWINGTAEGGFVDSQNLSREPHTMVRDEEPL